MKRHRPRKPKIDPELLLVLDHIAKQNVPVSVIAKRLKWDSSRIHKYARAGGIKLSSFRMLAEAAGLQVEIVPRQVA